MWRRSIREYQQPPRILSEHWQPDADRTKVMEVCANAGFVITDNDLVWRQASGLTDCNESCAGDSKLFYVLQKKMIVEMIMDALTLDAQTVSDLEDACAGVPPLQFNMPQGATGGNARYRYKPDFTAHFNKQKKYHEEQRREGKAFGRGDGDDMRTKWYYFEDVADLLCAQCHAEGAQSTTDHQYNADTCINCRANGLIEQNTMYKGADRPNIMKRFFADCSLVLGDINEPESAFDGDMETFVQHLIVSLFNKKFAKELSQIGGITLDKGSFADYFRSSNGKQLWVDRLSYIVTHSDGTKEKKTTFRVWRDYGNAVYALWMRWFMGQEQAYRVFSTDNEEKLGDGLETVLGLFDVISYFGKELPKGERLPIPTVRENMTSHMTGLSRKRSGTVKHMEVPSKTVRDIMDRLEYSNPFINIEEAGSSGQKRKAGESDEDEADRGREPDDAEEPEAKQSRVEDIASRRAELLRMFEDLCDRAGELQICMKRGKESHEGTCKNIARAIEFDSARGKITMLFLPEGHPSSDEDIEMEAPDDDDDDDDDEEMAPTNRINRKRGRRSSIRGRSSTSTTTS